MKCRWCETQMLGARLYRDYCSNECIDRGEYDVDEAARLLREEDRRVLVFDFEADHLGSWKVGDKLVFNGMSVEVVGIASGELLLKHV
jgi:hypothetical protein